MIPTIENIIDVISQCNLSTSNLINIKKILRKVEVSTKIPTLAISHKGVLYINKKFWAKYAKNLGTIKFLLWHELLHGILKDTARLTENKVRENHAAYNFAMDMRINSVIWKLAQSSNFMGSNCVTDIENFLGTLYKTYPDTLLRYGCASIPSAKISRVYELVWRPPMRRYGYTVNASPYDKPDLNVDQLVKELSSISSSKKTVFIGSAHDPKNKGKSAKTSKELKKALADVGKHIYEAGKEAGFGNILDSMGMDILAGKLNDKFVKMFATADKIGELRSKLVDKYKKKPTVIPLRPKPRDMAVLATGYIPSIWHNQTPVHRKSDLIIYLDVSGSVFAVLPKVLGLLRSIDRNLKTVYQFSNQVVGTSINTLTKGQIETTGGTDFNCIAQHLLDNKLGKKAVVITDGYANMSEDNIEALAKTGIKVFFVLTQSSLYGVRSTTNIAKKTGGEVRKLSEFV